MQWMCLIVEYFVNENLIAHFSVVTASVRSMRPVARGGTPARPVALGKAICRERYTSCGFTQEDFLVLEWIPSKSTGYSFELILTATRKEIIVLIRNQKFTWQFLAYFFIELLQSPS